MPTFPLIFPFTFGGGGTAMAQKLYCISTDLSVPAKALAGLDSNVVPNAISRASSIADGYIRRRFDLPLVSWTQSLTQAVADIATWLAMKDRGFDPTAESTQLIRESYQDALAWLEKVANDKIDPAFVDSSGSGQSETTSVAEPERSFVTYRSDPPTGVVIGGNFWDGRKRGW